MAKRGERIADPAQSRRDDIEEIDDQGVAKSPQIVEWIERLDAIQPEVFLGRRPAVHIRCIYHTPVVIQAGIAPSGRRYEFQPGQVQEIDLDDVEYLLFLTREQRPCCSSGEVKPLKYFELA
jgi:hypothetical protein